MADYYPLLAKALANLPSRTAPTTRRAIYERARKALIGQLRSIQPPMPETQIAGEDAALDRAIERLEAEYAAQPPSPPRAAPPVSPRPPPSAGAPPRPPLASPSSPSAARPVLSAASRATPTATAPKPTVPAGASAPMRPPLPAPRPAPPLPRPLVPPAARPSTPGARVAAAGASSAPAIETAPLLVGAGASPSIAPPVEAYLANGAGDPGRAPPITPSPPALAPAVFRPGSEPARPVAPGRAETRRRNPWPLVAVALALGAAGAVAAAAYFWRETPQDFATKAKSGPPVIAAPAGQNKIAERVDGGEAAAPPAAGETPIPTVTVPVAPVPVAPASSPPAPAATPAPPVAQATPVTAPAAPPAVSASPSSGDTVAQAPPATPQATPVAAVPDASRAAILIALANEPQKPAVTLGNAVWSIIPATAGQPSTLGVRIEIDIPDQKMHATVTIRKNADASLPATHTIDLRATFADGAPVKGIKDMDLPRLHKSETVPGDPLSGVRVKINDGYFLVGLTRSDTDAARNLDLLANDNWFDFPLLLDDGRIAKLTFEKGVAGDRVMSQALNAWK